MLKNAVLRPPSWWCHFLLLLYNLTIYIGPVTYLLPTYAILLPEKYYLKNILVFHIGLYVDIGVDIDSSLKDKKVFTYFDFFSNPPR